MFEPMKFAIRYFFLFWFLGVISTVGNTQVKTDTLNSEEAGKLQKKFDKEMRK